MIDRGSILRLSSEPSADTVDISGSDR